MKPEDALRAMGLVLPNLPVPSANYVYFKRVGDIVYLSGQGPRRPDGSHPVGKIPADVSPEDAYGHAREVGLRLLAAMREAAGSLDRVEVVKLFGMVNAIPDFGGHPKIIDGCSDLLVAVLGDRGRHARSAVGMGSLPNGMTIEIEAIIRVLESS